mmetsp:Transcript_6909/g.17472  ORF Transcript_6909/g.17472 Transcript_6909/m.17472 type:complete len:86 (+) Transcript_6909:414-671(+)
MNEHEKGEAKNEEDKLVIFSNYVPSTPLMLLASPFFFCILFFVMYASYQSYSFTLLSTVYHTSHLTPFKAKSRGETRESETKRSK